MKQHNQWKKKLRRLQILFSILLVSLSSHTQSRAQNHSKSIEQVVSGIVRDERGDALPGVNIVIKGTQKGVATNQDGKYRIAVDTQDASLIYSFVGYLSQEVKINKLSNINISLQPEAKSLNEVVVIGYGTQKASDITGAVVSFDAKHLEENLLGVSNKPLLDKWQVYK